MGSIIGHRIDYNRVGDLRGQQHIPSKNQLKYPPPLREIATLQEEAIEENLKTNYKAYER